MIDIKLHDTKHNNPRQNLSLNGKLKFPSEWMDSRWPKKKEKKIISSRPSLESDSIILELYHSNAYL